MDVKKASEFFVVVAITKMWTDEATVLDGSEIISLGNNGLKLIFRGPALSMLSGDNFLRV
jgi:hypothetical protein